MRMNREEIMAIFVRTGAFRKGHFGLVSGLHSEGYVNKDAIFPHTEDISNLGLEIAMKFVDDEIDVVVGPEKGGIILSQWIAYHLTKLLRREILSVYAEKKAIHDIRTEFKFTRNYDKFVKGKRVLIVEDILTTGGSVKVVVDLVRSTGGIVVGLGALCNRGKVTANDVGNVPKFIALLDVELETYPPMKCPLCKQGIPIDIGKGK